MQVSAEADRDPPGVGASGGRVMEGARESRTSRALAGATVLQLVRNLQDDAGGRGALQLGGALLRAGARSLVAGGGGPLVGEFQALGGEWTPLDFHASSPLRRRGAVRALREFVTTESVDLVHAQGAPAMQCAARALRPGPTCLAMNYPGTPPPRAWRGVPEDAAKRADIVIAPSEFQAALVAERHGIAPERIVVVPRSIDTDRFDPAAVSTRRIEAIREAWRISAAERVVLAPGRLHASNGHFTLIEAARILVNGGLRRVVFVIAGEWDENDGYPDSIDERIRAQGVGSIFRRVGYCADMPAVYALTDLVVLATERPPSFSAIAAEAQAMGRPLLATDFGAFPEQISAPPPDSPASRTGWLFRAGDPFDLARTLAGALMLDPAASQTLGLRARHLAEVRFSPAQVTAATLATFAVLLERPASERES